MNHLLFWILFNIFVAGMLALDLGVFHRRSEALTMRQALAWSSVWVALAAAFAVLLWITQGRTAALEFSTGYVIELSLSVDNLFIFLLIFRYFHLAGPDQYRVLFWGIIGAIVTRAVFIFAGVGLIGKLHWIIYAFGILLIFSGLRLLFRRGGKLKPEKSFAVRFFRSVVPVADEPARGRLFVRRYERLYATSLLLVLLVIETTDVLFAVDSIPAVLAITLNTLIVYTSNIFAILGLRSLFFALSSLMEMFKYLHYGISCILIFVGFKMLASHYYGIGTGVSLAVIGGILLATITASVLGRRNYPA